MVNRVDAFNLKAGPTESGVMPKDGMPVGGEILPFNLFEAFPIHLILLLIMMIPLIILVYKKRDSALDIISRVFF